MLALQTQLTDEMITQAIAEAQKTQGTVIIVAIAMVALFILLAIFSTIRKIKRRRDNGIKLGIGKTILTVMTLILPIGVFGAIFSVLMMAQNNLKEDKSHADEWHVVTSEITDLKQEETTTKKKKKRNGRTYYDERKETHYYAYVDGFSLKEPISRSEYESYQEGDKVYVVVDHRGSIALLYSAEEYEYVGDKLK